MRLGQTSFIYFVSKMLASSIGFVATMYFTRTLGDEIWGMFGLVLAIVAWLRLGGRMGVAKAMKKRISEGEEPEAYFTTGLVTMGVLFAIPATAALLGQSYLNAYIGAPVAELVVVLLFGGLLYSFTHHAVEGSHLVHIQAGLKLLKLLSRSALQVLLVVFGFGISGLIVGYTLGWVVASVIGLVILSMPLAKPAKRHFISLFDFAKYSWMGSVKSRGFEWTDLLVLGAFVQSGLVGVYFVAWGVAKILTEFGEAMSSTLFPEMSKLSAQKDMEMVSKLVDDALAYGGLILIPGLVGGTLLGDRILLIFGPEFVRGTAVLPLLIAAVLIFSYQEQLLNTLNAIDRPDLAFWINLAFIGVNLLLNVVLIYLYGWVGAAVATAGSAVFGVALSMGALSRIVTVTVPIRNIAEQLFAALAMGVVVYGGRLAVDQRAIGPMDAVVEGTWTLGEIETHAVTIGLVALGAAVYFIVLMGVSQRFRKTIGNNLPIDVPFSTS